MWNKVSSGKCPNFFLTSRWSMVTIFPTLTIDCLGNPAEFNSFCERKYSSSSGFAGICEVIAARIMSILFSLYHLDEITRAGLCFEPDKLVKGKPIKTTSPGLKSVINRIFGIFPKLERLLCKFQKLEVFNFDFQ